MKRELKELSPTFNFSPELWGITKECNQKDFDYVISDSPYFEAFEAITPSNYAEEDLRTIAYLAPRHINRIAYNPKHIDYYFQCLGLLPYNETSFDINCIDINCPCAIEKDIPFSEWKELVNGRTPILWMQEEKGSVMKEIYLDHLDTPLEFQERETPTK